MEITKVERKRRYAPARTQAGQRDPLIVRFATDAIHAWPFAHRHQTRFCDPATRSAGARERLRVGCHSLAISGASVASEFVRDTRRPAQNGHAVPRDTRWLGEVIHAWSSATGQRHQAGRAEYATTSSGPLPFFSLSHSSATSGATARSEFVTDTATFAQKGQPVSFAVREFGDARHS